MEAELTRSFLPSKGFPESNTIRILVTIVLLAILFILTFVLSFLTSYWQQIPVRGSDVVPEAEIQLPKQSPVQGISSDVFVTQGCVVGGCNAEFCVDISESDQVFSACIAKPEFACYKNAICERQENGTCGWRQTPELEECLSKYYRDSL